MIALRQILFPTDYSESSDHARSYAAELAQQFGAHVTVAHVMAGPQFAFGYGIVLPSHVISPDVRERARRRLEEEAAKISSLGIETGTALMEGREADEILRLSAEAKADLIVMATHGRSALKQVFMGSTAERVVREAKCPVLTIRHPEHEFVLP